MGISSNRVPGYLLLLFPLVSKKLHTGRRKKKESLFVGPFLSFELVSRPPCMPLTLLLPLLFPDCCCCNPTLHSRSLSCQCVSEWLRFYSFFMAAPSSAESRRPSLVSLPPLLLLNQRRGTNTVMEYIECILTFCSVKIVQENGKKTEVSFEKRDGTC